MKLPKVIDTEDVGTFAKIMLLSLVAVCVLLIFALALGLAWTVFKVAGGL